MIFLLFSGTSALITQATKKYRAVMYQVIEANGGFPPLTYAQFCHVSKAVGPPPRPRDDVDLSNVDFVDLATAENLVSDNLTLFPTTPSPEMLGIERDPLWKEKKIYNGGEREALKYYVKRIEHEKTAFLEGTFMPNRKDPDIFNPPKSLSPDLRYGCLSVRKFYWAAMDAWEEVIEVLIRRIMLRRCQKYIFDLKVRLRSSAQAPQLH